MIKYVYFLVVLTSITSYAMESCIGNQVIIKDGQELVSYDSLEEKPQVGDLVVAFMDSRKVWCEVKAICDIDKPPTLYMLIHQVEQQKKKGRYHQLSGLYKVVKNS